MMRRTTLAAAFALLSTILFFGCGGRGEQKAAASRPPVILISIDTLRADHLPMYGYRNVETPHLDALRRDGVLYTSAWSQVPLTLPSHATVLTGLLPQHHRVRNNIGYHLDASVPTLASVLQSAGYATGGAVSAYVLRGATGIGRGFTTWDDAVPTTTETAYGALQRPGAATVRAAQQWIATNQAPPFFAFVHLFEPHTPYEPVEPFRSRFANPYDGEIATADAVIGDLVNDLKTRGIYDRALIIFFSDHGEGLSQHGEREHGIFLYRETTQVPLVVKLPNGERAGTTVNEPVGLVDVMPTVLEVTGVTAPKNLDGVSLLGKHDPERNVYSETLYPRIHLGASELRALSSRQYRFIQAPRPELYDLTKDPHETQNVLSDERRVYSAMQKTLEAYGTAIEMPSHIDREESQKLAALGYLSSAQNAASGPLPDPKDRIGEVEDLAKANDVLRAGRTSEGIALLRDIVKRNPRFSDAWNQLATTLQKEHRLEEAAEAYAGAIRSAPDVAADFALPLGTLLLHLGRLDDAAAHARLAEKTEPGRAHLLLALVALARRDPRTATAEAQQARNDATAFSDASVLLAALAMQDDRVDEASSLLDAAEAKARELHSGPVKSLESVRAGVYLKRGRPADAVAALRRAISAFPDDRSAYAQLAALYASAGRRADANAVLDELVRANPDSATQRFVAELRAQLGR